MNNVGGHIAILAGAGVAAALLGFATYLGQRMETAASAQAPVVVTVPARAGQPTAQPGPQQPSAGVVLPRDPTALTRQLQSELKRAGCYDGEISGVWTPRTREAMKAFTTRVNATLPVGLAMVRSIRAYFDQTGYLIGFKPAGGISTAKNALDWLVLMKEELGRPWLEPELFRFGASSLLTDIERQLEHYITGRYSANHRHAMA